LNQPSSRSYPPSGVAKLALPHEGEKPSMLKWGRKNGNSKRRSIWKQVETGAMTNGRVDEEVLA
jgi:hypothetical protein